MDDDERWIVEGGIERALIETHHLANISDLPEAELARRRLVEAQSADSLTRTRDHLEDASEFLELARLARRDCAAGFTEAHDLVARAEAALRFERPIPLSNDPISLFRNGRDSRPTLEDLEREAAVNSFEQLKHDVALEEAFDEIRRQATGVDDASHVPADPVTGDRIDTPAGDGADTAARDGPDPDPKEFGSQPESGSQPAPGEVGVEEALRLASLEVDIQRSLMRKSASEVEADSEFQFVSTEELASRDDGRAEES